MKEKFAIFLDIDGTLASTVNLPMIDSISEGNISTLKKAQQMGHYVFLNTGRAYSWIPKVVIEAMNYDGILSGIGTNVIIGGDSVYERLIDKKALTKILKVFWDSGVYMLFGGIERVFRYNISPWTSGDNYTDITAPDDFETRFKEDRIQKIEIVGTNINDAQRKVLEDNLKVFYHDDFIECTLDGASKSKAMELAASKVGVENKNCIAMGDSVNDIDMLRAAGIGVAMGNALDEVKQIADYVTDVCEKDGVAKAVERLLLK